MECSICKIALDIGTMLIHWKRSLLDMFNAFEHVSSVHIYVALMFIQKTFVLIFCSMFNYHEGQQSPWHSIICIFTLCAMKDIPHIVTVHATKHVIILHHPNNLEFPCTSLCTSMLLFLKLPTYPYLPVQWNCKKKIAFRRVIAYF